MASIFWKLTSPRTGSTGPRSGRSLRSYESASNRYLFSAAMPRRLRSALANRCLEPERGGRKRSSKKETPRPGPGHPVRRSYSPPNPSRARGTQGKGERTRGTQPSVVARFVMALAVRDCAHDGSPCFVCGAGVERVPIPHSDARLCPACVPKLGEVLSTASFALIEQWFVTAQDESAYHVSGGRASRGASLREGSRAIVDDPTANVLERYGLSAPATDESARTHLDLAVAYDEMSLVHDAPYSDRIFCADCWWSA